jgi:hypothetical protein
VQEIADPISAHLAFERPVQPVLEPSRPLIQHYPEMAWEGNKVEVNESLSWRHVDVAPPMPAVAAKPD